MRFFLIRPRYPQRPTETPNLAFDTSDHWAKMGTKVVKKSNEVE
jgi:hypothetical protein